MGLTKARVLTALGSTALAAGLLAVDGAPAASGRRALEPYAGIGSWISIYDDTAWRNPKRAVQVLRSHGIDTLYLETANYKQTVDVVKPLRLGQFIDEAHAAGIAVVGWYLPSLAAPQRDLRRALAGARLRTSAGNGFDSFALDIEATKVRSLVLRNRRAVRLARDFRRALPASFPLAAITIAPVGASPSYWPGYPFRQLRRYVDVMVPMTYFTARVRGAPKVAAYTAANLGYIRARVGQSFPIHPIGGESRKATLAEVKAFFGKAASCRTVGASLWEYGETTRAQWRVLAAPPAGDGTC